MGPFPAQAEKGFWGRAAQFAMEGAAPLPGTMRP